MDRAGSPTCFGREAELAAAAEIVDRIAEGSFVGVLIAGEPGIGKSTVLSAQAAESRAQGRRVVTGRADELEQSRPFGLLADAFGCGTGAADPRARQIGRLLAGDGDRRTVSNDAGLQYRAVDRFLDLVECLALAQPLVLVLDDLQWADPSSLLVLATLARRLHDLPIALVGGLRAGADSDETQRLRVAVEQAGGRTLVLGPLGDDAVRAVVTDLVGAQPGPGLTAVMGSAAGNPFFVRELLGAIRAQGILQVDGGVAETGEFTLPGTLRTTVLQRIGFLPAATLWLLRTASVLGTGFGLGELSAVTGRTVVELAPDLDPAYQTGVLVDAGDTVRFGHDLVRDAVYQDLPQSVRTGLHQEAAQRLAASGAPVVRVAEHHRRSARPGDREAVDWLTRASRQSGDLAPAAAARLLDHAVSLLPAGAPERAELRAERAGRLLWAGFIREAEEICRDLLGEEPGPVEGQVRDLLGRCLMAAGRMADAAAELEAAEQAPGASLGVRLISLASAGVAHLFAGRLPEAGSAADRARTLARHTDDPGLRARALTTDASVHLFQADLATALQLADRAVALADASPARQGHRDLHHLVRGHVLLELDRPAGAHVDLEAGMRLCEDLGMRWSLGAYQLMIGVTHFAFGDWDAALEAVDAGEDLSQETGENYNVIAGHCVRGLIALHRNDLTGARASLDDATRELERAGPRFHHHWVAWLRALLLEADGHPAEAHTALRAAWDDLLGSGLAVEYATLAPDLIRLAGLTGHDDAGRPVTAAVEGVAARNGVPSLRAAAWRCRGLHDDDPDPLRRAVTTYAAGPRPLEHALAAAETGAALARAGDREEAVALLETAVHGFEQLGADRGLARVLAELREIGVHRRASSPRGRAQGGWQSITPAEQRVVDLVVEGLTNPEIGERLFVSRRTVQTHLSHVFQKLELSSRSELAAAAVRRRG